MSKSKGNVIYADDLVDLFGVDAVRFFVLHEMPFENDGVITWDLMVERFNSELANTLGNLVNRTVSMSNKYFGGVVTKTDDKTVFDDDLIAVATSTAGKVVKKMDQLRVADAISEIFTLFKRCNKYIDETTPWVLAKNEEDKGKLNTVLYNLVESITIGATLLQPFMPETTEKILKQLNTTERKFTDLEKFGLYENGTKLTDTPEILFVRQDPEEVAKLVAEKEEAAKKEALGPVVDIEPKEEISFDDFGKMQFQVGRILECEEVPKSKKLLVSKVQIGSEVKQIVSGIKPQYMPKDMVGKDVMVLVNLKPAKLAGVLSEGMLLCAENDKGELSLMVPDRQMVPGAEIC